MGAVTVDNWFYPTPGTVPSWGIPVPAVNDRTVTISGDPGHGNRKGILVLCHPSENSDLFVPPATPSVGSGGVASFDYMAFDAALDDWVTVLPIQPVDLSIRNLGYPASMANVVGSDTAGHGAVLVQAYRSWLRKLCMYLQRKFAVANPPIVLLGYSLGAWVVAQLAATEQSRLAGYICHCLPTEWDQLYLGYGYPNSFTNVFKGVNCSGINLGTSFLSGVTIPGIIGHSEDPPGTYTDQVVGWTSGTTPPSNGSAILASAGNCQSYTANSPAPDHVFFSSDASEYAGWIVGNVPTGAPF